MAKNIKTIFLLSSLFFFALFFPKEIKAVACPTTTGTYLKLDQTTVGTSSCAFTAQVDGVDYGTLEIGPNFTLTIGSSVSNQTIVFGTGKLIKPATIIINKNGSALKKGYLYYQIQTAGVNDADEDGFMYPSTSTLSTTKYYSFTPTLGASGYVRVSLASTTKADCYDQNANARPGQTEFFTVHRGDGSFDYNCDDQITKKNSNLAVCYIGQAPEKKFFAFKSLFEKIRKILSKNLLFNFVWAVSPPEPPGEGGGGGNQPGESSGWEGSVPDCGQIGTFRQYTDFVECTYSTTTYTQACR